METESTKLDVQVTATSQDPSLGFLSTVIITLDKDDSIKSVGSYLDSSSPDSPIIVKLPTSNPDYIYLTLLSDLHDHLHDHVLSKQIADQIVEAQLRIQSVDHLPPQQPLFMLVSVKLTQKVYNVVPCNSAPLATDLDQESQEDEESKTCAICLENLSRRSKGYRKMPNCSHCFHERCVNEWLIRQKYSCPLCRRPI